MDRENNQYYEPTIRTSRNVTKEVKFNVNDFISKQKLISFLKDKIKYYERITKNDTEQSVESCILDAYRDILNFAEEKDA